LPTYRVSLSAYNRSDDSTITGTRDIVTHIAGCVDEDDAKAKARRLYSVAKFKSVKLAEKEGS
jgi:hypothetical protein